MMVVLVTGVPTIAGIDGISPGRATPATLLHAPDVAVEIAYRLGRDPGSGIEGGPAVHGGGTSP